MIDNVATNFHTNDVVDDTFVDLQHLTRCRTSNVHLTSLSLVRALGCTIFSVDSLLLAPTVWSTLGAVDLEWALRKKFILFMLHGRCRRFRFGSCNRYSND
jgi:hypothetical protein